MSTIINARSPYFVKYEEFPFQGYYLTSIQARIYVWTGLLSAVPTDATYEITKKNLGDEQFTNLELSQLIRDFLDTEYYDVTSGTIGTADDAVWVKVEVDLYDGISMFKQYDDTYLAFDGYGYFDEGVNPRTSTSSPVAPPTNFTPMVLMDNRTVYFKRGEEIRIPIFSESQAQSTTNISSVWNLEENYWGQASQNWDATSIPQTIVDSDDSADKIQYLIIDSTQAQTGDTITITSTAGMSQVVVITLQEIECGKFDDYRVVFYNKYGALQDFYMNKKSKKDLKVKSEDYNRNIFSRTNNNYNTKKHQKYTYNVQANQSITLNTEFFPESFNLLVEQMLLSEQVWLSLAEVVQPVVQSTKSLKYKTHVNDKLIQYTMEFDFSNSYLNNVI